MKLRSVVAPLIAGLGVMAALAACGPDNATKTGAAGGGAPAAPAKPAAALTVAKVDGFGAFVVNDKGRTVYRFDKDVRGSGTSACVRECVNTWQPLMESKNFEIRKGIDQALIGTVDRPEGRQLTLKGWPLYYFKDDLKLGQTAGQGKGGTWFAIAPDGSKAAQTGRAAQPGNGGGNY